MIQTLHLIFEPAAAWERLAAKGRSWTDVLVRHLIPLLVLVSVIEGYGLTEWGRSRRGISVVETIPVASTALFELARSIVALGVVLWAAKFIKSQSNSFYGRNTWGQAFAVAAYGLSPMFLLRMFDGVPAVSPWVTWTLSAILSVVALYKGLPRVLAIERIHVFGAFLTITIPILIVTGIVRLVSVWWLQAGPLPWKH